MKVDDDTLAAIRERVDIVALVGRTVALRRSGRRHVGLCPFHAEKTPSLSVAADKKLFHCFGCGAGGDAITFVMRAEGLDFPQALRLLAKESGVPLADLSPAEQQAEARRLALWRLNGRVRDAFARALWAPEGAAARAYLARRGIPSHVARAFGLGLGLPAPRLLAELAADGEVDRAALSESGLLGEERGHVLVAERLVFPIAGQEGRVEGFGGRRLTEGPGPKYVNSAQSPVFSKSRQLFGLAQAAQSIRRAQSVTVVEGYLDVLALATSGHDRAVAALGTALTAAHAELLRRLAPLALLVFDGDRAGRAAARKATAVLMAHALRVEVALLPPGEDPASLAAKHGARALRAATGQATPAVELFMAEDFAGSPGVEARAQAAWRLAPLIALCGDLERDLYVHRLAKRVGLPVDAMRRHLEAAPAPARGAPGAGAESGPARRGDAAGAGDPAGPGRHPAGPTPRGRHGVPAQVSRELAFLRELSLYPSLRARFGELADYSLHPGMGATWDALAEGAEPVFEVLARYLGEDLGAPGLAHARQLLGVWQPGALDADDERANRTFADVLARMKEQHLDRALGEVIGELRRLEEAQPADPGQVDSLLRRKRVLTSRRQALRQSSRAPPATLRT